MTRPVTSVPFGRASGSERRWLPGANRLIFTAGSGWLRWAALCDRWVTGPAWGLRQRAPEMGA